MALRSKPETGGDVEITTPGTWKPDRGGNIELRGGGAPAASTKFPSGFVINALSTLIIAVCIFGILTGAGVVLPGYSWACVGLLVGVINPMGRPKRS